MVGIIKTFGRRKEEEVNDDVEEEPSLINHDPYGDGWILEMELSHENEVDSLMSYEDYQAFLQSGDEE